VTPQSSPAPDVDTKTARLRHPSGWLALTRTESAPLIVDALLDLPPGREFNKTELADHAGIHSDVTLLHASMQCLQFRGVIQAFWGRMA
jgi:hypothetical protein